MSFTAVIVWRLARSEAALRVAPTSEKPPPAAFFGP